MGAIVNKIVHIVKTNLILIALIPENSLERIIEIYDFQKKETLIHESCIIFKK